MRAMRRARFATWAPRRSSSRGHAPGWGPGAGLFAVERSEDDVVDLLFDGHVFHEFRVSRIDSLHTYGTGCTFASAVAAGLALGHNLVDAAQRAQQYVAGAIAHAPGLGHGRGPLDHFWEFKVPKF
jgi:hydroxymethylpyrimidine/phosphomethylpyrimidine kinase